MGERILEVVSDAEKDDGSIVCAGEQMERRQDEEVGGRIQAVARGWG